MVDDKKKTTKKKATKKKAVKKVEEVTEVVQEEKVPQDKTEGVTEDWETYVRSELNAILDKFLPVSTSGDISIGYGKVIKEKTEGGIVYDESKVAGVEVVLKFNFVGDVSKKHITD